LQNLGLLFRAGFFRRLAKGPTAASVKSFTDLNVERLFAILVERAIDAT
jgi:hypothetical protein